MNSGAFGIAGSIPVATYADLSAERYEFQIQESDGVYVVDRWNRAVKTYVRRADRFKDHAGDSFL